jgi:hypothetical protein
VVAYWVKLAKPSVGGHQAPVKTDRPCGGRAVYLRQRMALVQKMYTVDG